MDNTKTISNTKECSCVIQLRIKFTMCKIARQIRKKGYATLNLKELEKIDKNVKSLMPAPANIPTDEFKTPLTHFDNSIALDTIIKKVNERELEVTYWWAHNSGMYEIIGISFFGKE